MEKSVTPRATAGKLRISFGLVNVGIGMAPMMAGKEVSGHRVCPTHGSRTKQHIVCEQGGEVLKQSECLTGYEYGDKLVTFEEHELASLAALSDGTIELSKFVPLAEIDPLYFEKSYIVWADKGHEQGFDLLLHRLREQDGEPHALVGEYVPSRSKTTRMLVIRYSAETGTLVAHTCNFASNVREDTLDLVREGQAGRPAPDGESMKLVSMILESLRGEFDPDAVKDTYTLALTQAIEAKATGGKVEAVEVKQADTPDLMAALRATLAEAQAGEVAA